MPDNEIAAHISTFIFGGTDTTAALMARILQVLSTNPSAQARLREEIATAGRLDHDVVMSLPFLDAVFKETLRMCA
jgi:cytochrome P450